MLPQGRSELDRIVDIDGAPVITPTAIYAASFQGRISAMRPSDGTELWERDTSTYVDLAVGYGNVYVVDDKSVITAIDQRTSSVAWEQKRAVQARPYGGCRGRAIISWLAMRTDFSTCSHKAMAVWSAVARSTATAFDRDRSWPTTSSIAWATAAISSPCKSNPSPKVSRD